MPKSETDQSKKVPSTEEQTNTEESKKQGQNESTGIGQKTKEDLGRRRDPQ